MDCCGQRVPVPRSGGGRAVSEVRERGTVVAAIVHDAGLRARPELIEAGVSMAAVVLENQRLAAEAEASLRELQLSRARLATGAERERRRIERDLHDGAQQRLVALRIELELAEGLVQTDAVLGAARLRELAHDVDEALEELRALAHGVYPPLLADRGLEEALRSVAARYSIRVDLVISWRRTVLHGDRGRRLLLHPRGAPERAQARARAGRVVVTLDGAAHELRFAVRDDGPGTADLVAGPASRTCAIAWPRSAATSTSPPRPAPAPLSTAACRRAERQRRLRRPPCASQTARSARVERSCLRRCAATPLATADAISGTSFIEIRTTTVSGSAARSRCAVSMPSILRIRTSSSTRSGRSAAASSSASGPEAAWPTSSKPGVAAIRSRAARRNTA